MPVQVITMSGRFLGQGRTITRVGARDERWLTLAARSIVGLIAVVGRPIGPVAMAAPFHRCLTVPVRRHFHRSGDHSVVNRIPFEAVVCHVYCLHLAAVV